MRGPAAFTNRSGSTIQRSCLCVSGTERRQAMRAPAQYRFFSRLLTGLHGELLAYLLALLLLVAA